MNARPLDLAEVERRAELRKGICMSTVADIQNDVLALIRYCRTARAALERINKDDPTDDPSNVIACDALRDLDAIAGEP